jgi:putative solute:sodium symporter small subunit
MLRNNYQKYWSKNLKYLGILLSLWFLVSFGCGILFVDFLDQYRWGGFKLGFWFSQQGSIYAFILIIFTYVFLMNRLDRRFGVGDKDRRPHK